MKRSTVVEAIAILFIILFLYTGISKWMDYDNFIETVGTTPLFKPIARLTAILLPAIEIFIVSPLLFFPRTRRIGLYTTLVLMTLFVGYILYILSIDSSLPCSCGGIIQLLSWKQHLLLNGGLILLALLALYLSGNKFPDKKNIKHQRLAHD